MDLLPSMAELTIMTASATLLGPEVRNEMFHEVSEPVWALYALLVPHCDLAPLETTSCFRA